MKKVFSFLFVLIISSFVIANPKPLGLELGKATISKAKSMYDLKYDGINKYTYGKMFLVDPKQLNIDGLRRAILIFDKKEVLQAVIMEFPKNFNHTYWNRLYNLLKKKYILKNSKIPFVGDRYANFEAGSTLIRLESPHLSFRTSVIYMTNDFIEAFAKKLEEEKSKEQKTLENAL